ncbi:MAG: bifunctional acetate--CoA ligase family protein/GNAT family N-acetyltransferase [Chthoniobacter sp.]|nr:bifunctional acetate--CoA ligase family protein/GNAT family N-acetyltransferase [Chthoniobacter sp.]
MTKSCAAPHPPPARRAALSEFFAPRSIAVIGATEVEHSVGRAILENLRSFRGTVFAINPKRSKVLGLDTHASIRAVTEPVDLAIIVTPAPTVPAIIGECAAAGVKGAVIISAGFKETGAGGAELERQIRAQCGNMRVLGPNCLGVMLPHLGLNATFAANMARPGNVAFLSQSGALCTAILDWSLREGVGFSAFASLGSMLDIGWGDLIEYFGDDPHTKSIVCYMESVGDARAFLSAAREVSFTKPIVVIKVGQTEAAAKAAASHTGSLTGSDAVLDAAFRRVGVVRVNTIEELFDIAQVLAKQPRPRGPRLAIVTNAGGPGALATDMLVTGGGHLATLKPETMAALNEFLPPAWSHGNPVDLLGAADAEVYSRAVEIVLRDETTDGVLVILTPQAMTDIEGTAVRLAETVKSSPKPVLASWMGGASLDAARAALNAAAIPTYDYPDAAARAFALMWQYSDRLRLLYERPALPPSDETAAGKHRVVERLITAAHKAGRTVLTEVESKHLLTAYGIPTVETVVARTEEEAIRHATALGYPVVLKVFSETITHKTDVGGVRLSLGNAAAVRRAWHDIKDAVTAAAGTGQFLGVTVQPMIPRDGIELIIGSSIDPQFGPVLVFGAGGELVEIMKDRAIGFPPLTTTLALRLMEHTRIFHALGGVRGRKAVNLDALAQLLVAFSQLVAEQPWIAEIDINPLLASSERLVALDARVILHPPGRAARDLPRLAIRPYPLEYVSEIRLPQGTHVTLRPIRPEDEELLIDFHSTLSEESVRLRYFGPLSLETRTAHQRLVRICFSDYDRELALVAIHGKGTTRKVIAVGRLNRLHGTNDAEFAVLVADTWQGHGLGGQLLESLVRVGRAEKMQRITGTILQSNHAMLDLCRRLGFELRRDPDDSVVTADLKL